MKGASTKPTNSSTSASATTGTTCCYGGRRGEVNRRLCSCCRSLLAFLFSQVGLASMVVAYSVLGGFLFQAIEAPAELTVILRLADYRKQQVVDIIDLFDAELRRASDVTQHPVHHHQRSGAGGRGTPSRGNHGPQHPVAVVNWTRLIDEIDGLLVGYQRRVAQAVKDEGWDGRDEKDQSNVKWSFAGALLFAVTVTTTIGYGHVVPRTPWGRFLTMIYALVGIPLTFLYLSTIGDYLARCFRIFYRRICCDVCCCQRCELARRRRHFQRQQFKNSALAAIKAASELPTPTVPAACYVPAWRSKLDEAMDIGHSMGRTGSLPDCVGVSATGKDPASHQGRGQGRIVDRSRSNATGRRPQSGGSTPIKVVRHSSMTLKGSAMTRNNTKVKDVSNVRAALVLSTEAATKIVASGKMARNDANKVYQAIADKRSKSVDGDVGKPELSARKGNPLEPQRVDSKQATVGLLVTSAATMMQTSMTNLASGRQQSDQASTSGVVSSKADTARTAKRAKVLRRSASERRSNKRIAIDGDCQRSNYDREMSSGYLCIPKTNADRQREHVEEDWKTLKQTTAKDASCSKSDIKTVRLPSAFYGGSLVNFTDSTSADSFVTAFDHFSSVADCVNDENAAKATISGPPIDKTKSLSFLPPVSLPRSTTSPTTLAINLVPDVTPATESTSDSMAMDISVRFDLPPAEQVVIDDNSRGCTTADLPSSSGVGHQHRGVDEKVRVPISICLIVIIGYVLAGSVLFMLLEDWDLLKSAYFCFVTLTTIGFGDVVPGTATDRWGETSTEKLVLCAVWLAFGLSLLAMCFNLMQEEVKEICKAVAKKCGLIRPDDS